VSAEQETDAGRVVLVADETWLTLNGEFVTDAVYDLLLNDRHVWSFQPARDAKISGDRARARWPKALRAYLRGRATVVLRAHAGDQVVARLDHVFGGVPDAEVEVTDKDGHALILDKWGRLIRPLSGEDHGVIDELMDAVERLLDDLRDKAGVPAFIC
jgi:hypothetical protein